MAETVKRVQEQKLIGGEMTVIHRETGADSVLFDDGETFQKKLDDGKLTGPAGTPGQGGAKGDPGDTWVPSVSEDGLLTWEKNSGTEPVPRNIKGADGAAGAPGPNQVTGETTTALNGLLKGDGAHVAAAVAGTDYAKAPEAVTVKLLSSGWVAPTRAPDPQQSASPFTSKMQTVDCAGVLANETLQEVSICPAAAQFKTYMDAGIYVSAVTDGKLTFTCDTAPASELTVYVKIQNL